MAEIFYLTLKGIKNRQFILPHPLSVIYLESNPKYIERLKAYF
jgi:hypothetical protein